VLPFFFLIKTDIEVNFCKYKFSKLRQEAKQFSDFFQVYWYFPIIHLTSFSILCFLLIQIL